MARWLLITFAGGALTAFVVLAFHPLSRAADVAATSQPRGVPSSQVIPGHYIVTLRDSANPDLLVPQLGRQLDFRASHTYREALVGFAAELSANDVEALRDDPNVVAVEPDSFVSVLDETLPTGIDRIDAEPAGAINDSGPDSDVDIAVIDTGSGPHADLNVVGGYASYGQLFVECGRSDTIADDHGHGTHVAGTIAARDNASHVVGVVPGARIWSVKVLGSMGFGCASDIIAGIDWVTAHADTIEVANMSLSGGSSSAVCGAIAASVAAGVTYVVSAGNSADDASGYSPANCAQAITVSALADFDGRPGGLTDQTVAFSCTETQDDSLVCFSNYGQSVDIAGPGVRILSLYLSDGLATASGTSMSSPHVAGAAARYKLNNPGASPAAVRAALIAAGECPGGEAVGVDEHCDSPWPDDTDGYNEPLVHLGSALPIETNTPTLTPTVTKTPTVTPTPTPEQPWRLSLYVEEHYPSPAISGSDKTWDLIVENRGGANCQPSPPTTLHVTLTGQADSELTIDVGSVACAGQDRVLVTSTVLAPAGGRVSVASVLFDTAQATQPTARAADVVCLDTNQDMLCDAPSDDTDNDGCLNDAETRTAPGSERTGGRRDPNNFWDFFDTPNQDNVRDKRISAADIVAVVRRSGATDLGGTAHVNRNTNPLSAPPPGVTYHPAFDRSGSVGPNRWSLGPPDGRITSIDIIAVVRQYPHSCM